MSELYNLKHAIEWADSLRVDLFKSQKLGYLILLVTLITLAVGVLLFLLDPSVKTPIDGIWSAWVTMTHVGYGDVVPTSFLGRLLAAALILLGLVFFSLFTALVSSILIDKNFDKMGIQVKSLQSETHSITQGEQQILEELQRLKSRVDELQSQMASVEVSQ